MGEYLGDIKLGTCESLYYTTFSQLASCNLPGKGEYLDPRNGYRYRFPFPDEDGTPIGTYQDYNRGFTVACDGLREWFDNEHGTVSSSIGGWYQQGASHNSGCPNVNISVPCPQGGSMGDVKHSPLPQQFYVQIVQQKQVDGKLWTVVRCPYCGTMIRLPHEQANILVDALIEQRHDEIAMRVIAGYLVGEDAPETVTA